MSSVEYDPQVLVEIIKSNKPWQSKLPCHKTFTWCRRIKVQLSFFLYLSQVAQCENFDRNTVLFSAALAPHPAGKWWARRTRRSGFRCKRRSVTRPTNYARPMFSLSLARSLAHTLSSYHVSDNMTFEKTLLDHVAVMFARANNSRKRQVHARVQSWT